VSRAALLERARQLAGAADMAIGECDRLEAQVGKDAGVDMAVQHAIAHERQMSLAMSNLGLLFIELAREAK
jgi:hypothetical protein